MPEFSESLTIRILGDSSQFQRELESVSERLSEVQGRLSELSSATANVDRLGSRFSAMTRPLGQVSSLLSQITSQAQTLGRLPITLNITPAVQSLQVLGGLINQVGFRLQSLSLGASLSASPSIVGLSRFARGGLVSGPSGIDRVPAMLTAGEFVLRPAVVKQLGVGFLRALNEGRTSPTRAVPTPAGSSTQQTVNHFGGITVQVRQAGDVNSLVRDLRFQNIQLKNRRG